MNYAAIRNYDIANGEGVRTSLFVSGCNLHCPGCFNPEAQDFEYGEHFTDETVEKIIAMVSEPTISGLSILGGDPLCQNADGMMALASLCRRIRDRGKTTWLWTGFLWEDVFALPCRDIQHQNQKFLLADCDVVVDGPFKQELADRKLVWRGSANQRIIDVQKTIRSFTEAELRLMHLDYASQNDPQILLEEYLPIKNFELLYGWWKAHYKATLKNCDNPLAVLFHLQSSL